MNDLQHFREALPKGWHWELERDATVRGVILHAASSREHFDDWVEKTQNQALDARAWRSFQGTLMFMSERRRRKIQQWREQALRFMRYGDDS